MFKENKEKIYEKIRKSWEQKLPRYGALFEPIRNWVIFGLGKDTMGLVRATMGQHNFSFGLFFQLKNRVRGKDQIAKC